MNTKNHTLNASRSGFYLKALPSAILAACLFPAVASSANLLINPTNGYNIGTFEDLTVPITGFTPCTFPNDGSIICDFFSRYPNGSSNITGWTVDIAGGSVNDLMDVTKNGNPGQFLASEGTQLVDLADINGFGKGIRSNMTIPVIAGQTYRLKFDIGNHQIFRSSVGVALTGGKWADGTASTAEKKVLSAVSPNGINGGPVNDWRTVTFDWIPDPGTTTTSISFFGRDPGIKGYPSTIAGYNVVGTAQDIIRPSTVPPGQAWDLALADATLTGLNVVPPINFDENITLDNVSLELLPTTPNLVLNGSFEAPLTSSFQLYGLNQGFSGWNTVNAASTNPNDQTTLLVKTATGNANTPAADKYAASQGLQFVDLAGTSGFDKGLESVAINVVAGKRYTLSFDIGSYDQYFSTVGVSMSSGLWGFGETFSATNELLFYNHVKALRSTTENTTNWKTITLTWIADNTGTTKIKLMNRSPNAAPLNLGLNNTAGTYAQDYTSASLVDNVKLQDAFIDRTAYTGNFDGGTTLKTADVLWRDTETGNVYLYNMNGAAQYTEQPVGTLPDTTTILGTTFKTKVFGTGDFNVDGKADILLQSNGQTRIHLTGVDIVTNGIIGSNATSMQPVNANWEFAGTGDFNNDGRSDIVWRNYVSNKTFVDLMDGVTVTRAETTLPAINTNWKLVGTGDFNGDGYADILWRNIFNNNTFVDLMKPGFATVRSPISMPAVNLNWQVAGTGDYNGDGKTDILWRNFVSNNTFVDLMNGAANTRSLISLPAINANWKVAGTGDYNGDGKADILWRNFVSNMTFVDLMNGASVTSRSSITPVALPL